MSLFDVSFLGISREDLDQLILNGVQEGSRIEYKRETYGGSDGDKKEFLKDITSFANTYGGHLVIGINEEAGLPTAISPITIDSDAEILRLEALTRDGVEPRVLGLQMKAVPVPGGAVIVIRVPGSWNAPHRVSFKGTSRFYARTSAGVFEPSIEELRAMFSLAAGAMERAKAFRQRRLAMLENDEGTAPLARSGGYLTIHIYPLASTGAQAVDLAKALEISDSLAPPAATGWSPEFNFDGFANIRSGEKIFGYTQLFRDGSIEATKVRIVAEYRGVKRIPAIDLSNSILKTVPKYLQALEILKIQPPFAVMITLSGVRGAYLGYSENQWLDTPAVIRKDVLELPIITIVDYGNSEIYVSSLRPAFDAIWNAGGLSHCTYFSNEGVWRPHN